MTQLIGDSLTKLAIILASVEVSLIAARVLNGWSLGVFY